MASSHFCSSVFGLFFACGPNSRKLGLGVSTTFDEGLDDAPEYRDGTIEPAAGLDCDAKPEDDDAELAGAFGLIRGPRTKPPGILPAFFNLASA